MSDIITLAAARRQSHGTGASRELRRKGMVPGIVYGKGHESLSIALEEKEITKYYRKPQFISQVIEFEIDGRKHKVLPKAVDLHPITDVVYHADFVFLAEKMQKMQLPIVYLNKENCIGVKRGGYFNTVKRSINILCPVDQLSRKAEIDVSDMPIGTSIKLGDIPLPKGAKLVGDNSFVVASIIGKKGKSELDEEIEEGAEETEEPASESK